MIKKIVFFCIFILILGVSLIALPRLNESLELRVGDFSVWTSPYALGIRNTNPPGAFYTITPFDDLLVYQDGSEAKIGSTEDEASTLEGLISRIVERLNQFRRDVYLLVFSQLHTQFANTESGNSIAYIVQTLDNTLVINRHVNSASNQAVIAVGKSIIFNENDQVFIDGVALNEVSGLKQEGRLLTHPGAQYIDLFNPQLSYKVRINTTPAQTIVIDPDFHVITIKTFFDEPKTGQFATTQVLEIIKND
jgi:hypothetical protein